MYGKINGEFSSRIAESCTPNLCAIIGQIGDEELEKDLLYSLEDIKYAIEKTKRSELFKLRQSHENIRQSISSSATISSSNIRIRTIDPKLYKKSYNKYVENVVEESKNSKIRQQFCAERAKLRQLIDDFVSQETEVLKACDNLLTDSSTLPSALFHEVATKIEKSQEKLGLITNQYRILQKIAHDFNTKRAEVVLALLKKLPYTYKQELEPFETFRYTNFDPEYFNPRRVKQPPSILSNPTIATIFA